MATKTATPKHTDRIRNFFVAQGEKALGITEKAVAEQRELAGTFEAQAKEAGAKWMDLMQTQYRFAVDNQKLFLDLQARQAAAVGGHVAAAQDEFLAQLRDLLG